MSTIPWHMRCVFQELPEPNRAYLVGVYAFLIWNNLCDLVYQTDTYRKLPESDSSSFRYTRSRGYQTTTRHALLGSGSSWKTHLWCGLSANLECRSERCCTHLAANAGPKKVAKNRHLGTIPQISNLSGYIFATKACIDNQKKLVKQQYLLYMSTQYGELRPSSGWDCFVSLGGTPVNFNGFRVLAALLYGTLVVGISQTVALNRGCHLYSAGRPSRWAFAHISSKCIFCFGSFAGKKNIIFGYKLGVC